MHDCILSCMISLIIIHDFHIFLVGNISATHRLEMRSFQLAIYHPSSMFFHKRAKKMRASLEADGTFENILSPMKTFPMVTP